MKYDEQRHMGLVEEKSKLTAALQALAVKLHDQISTDGWEGDDGQSKLTAYMADQQQHGQLTRELQVVNAELDRMESVKPVAKTRMKDTMMGIRNRWMAGGSRALGEDERKLFIVEATPEMIAAAPMLSAGGGAGEVFDPYAIVMADSDPLRSDIDSGDESAAGLAAPETWAGDIVERLAYFGAVAQNCHNFTTSNGNDLHQNQLDTTDEEGGAITDQSQVAGTGLPPVAHDQIGPVTDIVFKASWRHSNLMSVRLESFGDLHFDVAGRVMREAMRRQGRGWNRSFTTGSGVGTIPQGLVTSATILDGEAGSADDGSGGIDYENLLACQYAVDLSYLTGNEGGEGAFVDAHGGMIGWQMNRNVEKQLREGVDQNGRPIWLPYLDIGRANQVSPGTILGYPYSINQHMDDGKSNNDFPLLFGSFGHYGVRNIGGPMFYRFFDSNTITAMSVVFIGLSRRDARSRGPTVAAKNEAYVALQVKS